MENFLLPKEDFEAFKEALRALGIGVSRQSIAYYLDKVNNEIEKIRITSIDRKSKEDQRKADEEIDKNMWVK